jgi:membrane fusion protein (multidrug efflux system)
MDGDLRTRFRRVRSEPGQSWGYSATVPADLDPAQLGQAYARAEPPDTGKPAARDRTDDGRKDKDGKSSDKSNDDAKNDGDRNSGDKEGDDKGGDSKSTKTPMPRWKKALYWIIGLAVLAVLITAGVLYWLHARHFENTDDAFIDGHMSQVSAQVAGRITTMAIQDNQLVTAGAPLLQIDPRDYQVRLATARAQRAQAAAQLDQAKAGLLQQQASYDQSLAQVRVSEAELGQQQADLARFRAIDPKAITRQQLDTTSAQTKSAAARLDASRQAVQGARAQIEAQKAMIEAAEANVQSADASVANAQLQLDYTVIRAPQDGRVTRRTVELGNYANPGQSLLAIVPDNMWVTANFKETQLAHMQVGQHVRVSVDACPDSEIDAHVDSFQTGTGAVFSSLPAENATGNYVKVVQRVPVKIVFDKKPEGCHLAPGLSVSPRVTVR